MNTFEQFFLMLKCFSYNLTFGTTVVDMNDLGTSQTGGFISIITLRRKEYVKFSPHSRSLKEFVKNALNFTEIFYYGFLGKRCWIWIFRSLLVEISVCFGQSYPLFLFTVILGKKSGSCDKSDQVKSPGINLSQTRQICEVLFINASASHRWIMTGSNPGG